MNELMGGLAKRGLLGVCGAAALLVMSAAPAQALEILPLDTSILGTSSLATFEYGGATVTCQSAEVGGKTAKPASAAAKLTSVTFGASGGCETNEKRTATVTTTATGAAPFFLEATKETGGGSGEGLLQIPSGGKAVVKVYEGIFQILVCELVANGLQNVQPAVFDASKDTLTFTNATVSVKRFGIGGESCGPAESTALFNATYSVSPSNLEIKK